MISFSQKQKLSPAIGKITYMFNAAAERCWFQAHETQRKHIWRGGRVVECKGLLIPRPQKCDPEVRILSPSPIANRDRHCCICRPHINEAIVSIAKTD